MPRNSSGTYSLPAGNPVVSNTLIQTTWANPTMSDLGTALTDSLDRQGRGSMLAPLKGIDGSAVAPSLTFSSEGTLGIYRVSAGVLGIAAAGALVLSISSSGLTFTEPLVLPVGSATAPSLTFTANTNTGIYSPTANQVAITTNGAQRLLVDATGILALASGTVQSPGPLLLQTSGANTRLTVDAAGRVGIGTTPTQILDIDAASASNGTVNIALTNAQSAAAIQLLAGGTALSVGGLSGSSVMVSTGNNTNLALGNLGAGSGIIQFLLGGSQRACIDASGRLGIGRTPTTQLLEVAGSASTVVAGALDTSFAANVSGVSVAALGANNSGATNALGAPTGTAYVGVTGTGIPLVFTTASAERMRIDATGKVIVTTGGAAEAIRIVGTDSFLSIFNTANTTRAAYMAAGAAGFDLAADTAASNIVRLITSGTPRVIVDSSGRVGLGTAPAQPLDVLATSASNGTVNIQLTNGQSSTAVSLLATGTTTSVGGLGSSSAMLSTGSNNNLALGNLSAGTGVIQVLLGGSERARFDASGNFVVGATTATGRLTVVSTSSAAAANIGWSNAYSAFGPNASSTTGAAFGIGYNNTLDQTELLSLAPGTAWKPLRTFGSAFRWIIGGTTTVLDISSTGIVSDSSTNELGWKDIPQNNQTAAYTLVIGDRGKSVTITTGGVTVPAGVFSAGNVVTITNNSGTAQTITQGSSATVHQAGTTNTGNRTLLPWGICTLECIASNTFIIAGNVT
jgi:hypothetical protein